MGRTVQNVLYTYTRLMCGKINIFYREMAEEYCKMRKWWQQPASCMWVHFVEFSTEFLEYCVHWKRRKMQVLKLRKVAKCLLQFPTSSKTSRGCTRMWSQHGEYVIQLTLAVFYSSFIIWNLNRLVIIFCYKIVNLLQPK